MSQGTSDIDEPGAALPADRKRRCKECKRETTFPPNAIPEREKKGWCASCYDYWLKKRHEDSKGNVSWKDPSGLDERESPEAGAP